MLLFQEKAESSFLAASSASVDDTPKRLFLKYGIRQLSNEIQIKNNKLKTLQQTIRHKNKNIAPLTEIFTNFKNKNLVG